MKRVFLSCAILVAMCLCTSCNDDDEKKEDPGKDSDKIEVYSIDPTNAAKTGSNKIVMINHGGGNSYWVHPLGTSTRANDTIVLPFTGKYEIIFEENTMDGAIQTKNEITVTTLDTPVDPFWALLAGTNGAGKTWVWATGSSHDILWAGGEFIDEFWEEGYDPHSIPSNSGPEFWEEYFDFWDGIEEDDMDGWFEAFHNEMYFDFKGNANYKLLVKADEEDEGEETTDVFQLDVKNKTLSTVSKSTPFLWSPWHWDGDLADVNLEGVSEISTYNILKLTENELILSFEYNDEYFVWFFKKKGYEF
jgi:hypothetical protein